jgi:hypothetical protein
MILLGRTICNDLTDNGVIVLSNLRREPVLSTKYTTVFVKFTYDISDDSPYGRYTLCIKLWPSSDTVVYNVN